VKGWGAVVVAFGGQGGRGARARDDPVGVAAAVVGHGLGQVAEHMAGGAGVLEDAPRAVTQR
jgi:hypothetical protein